MRWSRPAQRALILLVALVLAAAARSLMHRPGPVLRPVADEPALDLRIDLNRADAAQLEAVPGIGPALAARILEHRAARAPFGAVEDLEGVPGIGPKTVERLRPYLVVGTDSEVP